MKPYCPQCKEYHSREDCPRLKLRSHGNPRVEAKPVAPPPPVPRKPMGRFSPSPLIHQNRGVLPDHIQVTKTPATKPPKDATKTPVTKPVTIIPVTGVTKKTRGRPKSGNALSPSEKQKAYRARKREKSRKKP